MSKVVSRPNKFFLEGVEPPRMLLTLRDSRRVVQVTYLQTIQTASSQLARVPGKAKVVPSMIADSSLPPAEVIPSQEPDKNSKSISEGQLASWDLLEKRVMEAKGKKQIYWARIYIKNCIDFEL